MSPVWQARITSTYTNARRHPILKITRPQDLALARFYLEHADELEAAETAS